MCVYVCVVCVCVYVYVYECVVTGCKVVPRGSDDHHSVWKHYRE